MYQLDPQPVKKKSGCLGKIFKGLMIVVGLFIALIVVVAVAAPKTPSAPPTPAMSLAEMRSKAKSIEYKELARNTEQYVGTIVKYDGEIVQVIEGYGSYTLRVNITKKNGNFWDDTVLVTCTCPKRPLEDDIISLVGTVDSRQSYKTILGATITLPQINAQEVQIAP